MKNLVETVDPNDIEWSQSKSAPAGCWGKSIFRYDQGRLGDVGRAGGYTVQYKFEPNSFYRPLRVIGQPVEVFVLSGTLNINDQEISTGQWTRALPVDEPLVFGSVAGAEIIAIVRGEVELAEKVDLGEKK